MKKRLLSAALVAVSILCAGCNSGKQLSDILLEYKANEAVARSNSMVYDEPVKAATLSSALAVATGQTTDPANEKITAQHALMIDITDKTVLYEDKALEKAYPASITKLLTALVVLRRGKLDETVTFSHAAANLTAKGAKKCGFKEGDKIVLKDLLTALLVYSGNDAAIAIADHVSGSEDEFVKLMNETAQNVGASHTHFVNPHGLHDADHYTTAYDLYVIFNECLRYPEFKEMVKNVNYTVNYKNKKDEDQSKTFKTTNLLLSKAYPLHVSNITVLGGKTGTTDAAGRCILLYSKNTVNDHEYVSVVLGAKDLDDLYFQTNYLLEYAQ